MKKLTKKEIEEIKESMESGIPVPVYFRKKGLKIEKGDMQSIVSQLKSNFGEEGFSKMREAVIASRRNGRDNKGIDSRRRMERLHETYSSLIGNIDSVELSDSCISDLQELLVLCEVRKNELRNKE
jgi:hypothetical protein